MSASATATATGSLIPGVDGECGHQHDNAPCLPMEGGRMCCSVNGYCGSNETYCLISNGCQSGCVDPSVFSSQPTLTTSTNTASSSITTTSFRSLLSTTSSPTTSHSPAATTKSSGLQGKAKTGVIVGSTVGGVLFLVIIAFVVWRQWYKKKFAREEAERQRQRELERQREVEQAGDGRTPTRNEGGPSPLPGLWAPSALNVLEHQ